MRCLRFVLPAVTGVLLCASKLLAQGGEIGPRISGLVDENSLLTLEGNVPRLARAEFDRGEAAPSTRMLHVRLVLSRNAEQQAGMNKYARELQDKSSPNYHTWLTPEQFGTRYGPADADIAVIVAWLESHGLEVDPVPPGRTDVSFSGSVQRIEQTLHTTIHIYQTSEEEFLSNISNPAIPTALAGVVSGVAHLNTIKPKPQHTRSRMGMFDPVEGRMKAVTEGKGPRSELTTGSGNPGDPYQLYLVAGDAATIYDTPNSFNAKFPTSGASYTGMGVTIGIGGDAVITPPIVANYRGRFVGDTARPTITNVDGVTATVDSDEAYLDNEIAGGLAPGATIHFYTATSLDTAIAQMVSDNKVDIISISFGTCEFANTTIDNQMFNTWWEEASVQGIAVVVATGDSGSAGCDDPHSEAVANGGLAVNALASTPYNVAVGGTDFAGIAAAASFTTYVSTSSLSTNLYRTALGYIPESTWNDSTTVNTTLGVNVPVTTPANILAGSGGQSSCSTNTGTGSPTTSCMSGYAKPFWQRGANVPADGVRDLPDVSLMAGDRADNAAWLVCTPDTGLAGGNPVTTDCSTQGDGHFYFIGIGGTSAATPAFAGMLALVQEKTGGRLGLPAMELYDLSNDSHSGAIFHDITSGNNSVPCASGSLNCATNTAGYMFMTGYDAESGYDLATGLGSIDVTQLVTYWGSSIGSQPTTVTVKPSRLTITEFAPLNVAVTVTGSSTVGNPTGTVRLSGGGYISAAQALAPTGTDRGTYTFSVPAGSLATGSDALTVSYSGDADYGTQTGTANVTVTGLTPTVTVVPGSASINSAQQLTVTTTVTGTGGTPTGTVTLRGDGYTSAAQTLDSTGKSIFTVSPYSFGAPGNQTLTVSYSGDSVYNGTSGSANITVMLSSFSVSATDVTLTAGATSGNVSTVTVTPIAGYTGTVTLAASVLNSPSGGVSAPTLTVSPTTIMFTSANNAVPQTAQIAVATTTASAIAGGINRSSVWFRAAGGTALAALVFLFVPLGSRRGRRILGMLLMVAAGWFALAGCGGGGGGGTTKITPGVTVSPSKSAISAIDALSVGISVSGGTTAATGSVTLAGGGYTSGATSLSSGAATVNIPANSLSLGSDTLTATYSGDSNYNSATGATTVTVNNPGTTTGAYTIQVTGTGNDAAHNAASATFTLTVQ